jgi:hypothetical protein
MTDHHHPDQRSWDPLYFIDSYDAAGVQREVLLVDLPRRGLAVVDVRADSDDDQHLVAADLHNVAEAGDVADAYLAASIVLGRPAVASAEPPTAEQLRYLRELAERLGQPFRPPKSKAEAARAIQMCSPSRWCRGDHERVGRGALEGLA